MTDATALRLLNGRVRLRAHGQTVEIAAATFEQQCRVHARRRFGADVPLTRSRQRLIRRVTAEAIIAFILAAERRAARRRTIIR